MKHIYMFLVLPAFAAAVLMFCPGSGAVDTIPPEIRERGGLCVLIGEAGDIAPAVRLLEAGPWVIHWLDAGKEDVENARRMLRARDLYGRATVEHWDGDSLPYSDNLVNLLIVRDGGQTVRRREFERVLAPGGSAFFSAEGLAVRFDKPTPPEMGEWTHPWQNACGGLASADKTFRAPNSFQWIAGPVFPLGGRKDSASVVLSAGGRIFSVTQNVPQNIGGGRENYLVARDAFSGVPLWSRRWNGPVRRHSQGATQSIVASEHRVYAANGYPIGNVAVLDAATGKELEVWPTNFPPEKLVLSDGILVAQMPRKIAAFRVDEKEEAWSRSEPGPWGTLVYGGKVFYLTMTRQQDGGWLHELLSVDLNTGETLWSRPIESEHGHRTAVLRLHFAGEGFVSLIERTVLRVLSAENGEELWRRESEAEARGSGGMDSRQAGHFYAHGKIWFRATRASGGRDAPEKWLALDPLSGEVRRELTVSGPQGVVSVFNKISCQPLTATENYVLDARLSTAWDFKSGQRQGWKFVRGGCQVGMVPANGMGYVPPNACGCLEEQLRGFVAVVHTDDKGVDSIMPSDLQRGPAYGCDSLSKGPACPGGWPAYRRDGRRGAYIPEHVPVNLNKRWEAKIFTEPRFIDSEWLLRAGRVLTPPVVSAGIVVVAEPQTHTVFAIDETAGEKLWDFTAGGRITVPPAIYRGLVLLGAHDGFLYALRTKDGELAWRRRIAPSDRRIMAYGQLESAWPLSGGVLVHNGLALAAAGRTADSDGGIAVKAVNPVTGELIWSLRVENARYGMPEPLVTEGFNVYLMDKRIDAETGDVSCLDFRYRQSGRGGAQLTYPDGVRYLRGGKAGLMETSWTVLDSGLRKAQSAWSWGDAEGELLSFAGERSFAYKINAGGYDARGRALLWLGPVPEGGGEIVARTAGGAERDWSFELPEGRQPEAMIVSENALFVSGPVNRAEPGGKGFLSAFSLSDGEMLSDILLEKAPVHDGIAASNGRIFIVFRDGRVVCFDGPE